MDRRAAAPLLLSLVLGGCASPEAARTRGGGFGADVRNVAGPVIMHDGAEPYYRTHCVSEPVECSGPVPVFGPSARE